MSNMGEIGKATRLVFFASATALAALGFASPEAGGDRLETSATASSETTKNASSLPDPGDDWILRKRSGARVEAAENDGGLGTERFATLADVAAVGRIVAVGSKGIETEDRRRNRRERTPKRPGDAILFLPPVDPSAAEAFCVEIREAGGDRDRDRFWLRNGDEFDGELLKIDRRRVWIRAFDVEFAVPRGRVRAVRFATIEKKTGKDEKNEIGENVE